MALIEGTFTFLGTSSSMGVPVIGCSCSVCTSSSIYNKRKRCAALIEVSSKKILLDAGPEIRMQLLDACINDIDGVIITHGHFDHIAGVDDLKSFYYNKKSKLPMVLPRQTYNDFCVRNQYMMDKSSGGTESLFFDFHIIDDMFSFAHFCGVEFSFLGYQQNNMDVLGFKLGNLAYLSDIKQYSDRLLQEIQGIDVLIISALRKTTSNMHLSIDEAIAFAQRIGAKKTYFTHMAHEVDYESDAKHLPKDIFLAYDGLQISFNYYKGIV